MSEGSQVEARASASLDQCAISNVPVMIKADFLSIEKLAVKDDKSGWRDADSGRVGALTSVFIGGQWGLTCGSEISVLEATNLDQDHIIDDGLSSATALFDLKARWLNDSEKDVEGKPWDDKLVALFQKGVFVKFVKYDWFVSDQRHTHAHGRA